MKKITWLAAALILAGSAYSVQAAPVSFVGENSGDIGYLYNGARDGTHNVYLEYSPISKLVVGAEYRKWIHDGSETDVYAKYRIGHAYVGVGSRNYVDRGAKAFGLVEGRTNLADKLDGYASLKISSEEKEWQVGVLYDLIPRLDLNVNYTYYNRDHSDNKKGVGIGLNYRF